MRRPEVLWEGHQETGATCPHQKGVVSTTNKTLSFLSRRCKGALYFFLSGTKNRVIPNIVIQLPIKKTVGIYTPP